MNDALRYVDAFANLNVLVVGDAMLDRFVRGRATRLAPEAPSPVVDVEGIVEAPGGAANVAANAAALGASAALLALVGDDDDGAALTAALRTHGVETSGVVTQPGRRTLAKTRVSASGHVLVRYDEGSTDQPAGFAGAELEERLADLIGRCDVVVVSDYGYGVMSDEIRQVFVSALAIRPVPLVVDAKDLGAYQRLRPAAVKPNYAQAATLAGAAPDQCPDRAARVAGWQSVLLDRTGAGLVAVTLDEDGAVGLSAGAPPIRTATCRAPSQNAVGSGDTFAAALALALGAGASHAAAMALAAQAAAAVLGGEGTTVCAGPALGTRLSRASEIGSGLSEIAAQRSAGRRIVFTNGVFDILHDGHVQYLEASRALGDVLVVGINSDDSVRRLKGPSRPVNDLARRARVLAALGCVDYVVPFDSDTPEALVRQVRPHVYTKGGDYAGRDIPETTIVEAAGGRVEFIPFVPGRSSTAILARTADASRPALPAIPRGAAPGAAGGAAERARWAAARRILCVRLDGMGDVLMTGPAIRAVAAGGARVTLLTSEAGAEVAPLLPGVADVIPYAAPWVKNAGTSASDDAALVQTLRERAFDGAVIFTVYTQSALPAALACRMAGVPLRLARSRENPYGLLTLHVPEDEPEPVLRHEVERQLSLVAAAGFATPNDASLRVRVPSPARRRACQVLGEAGLLDGQPWLVLHPGASAQSRRYPVDLYAEAASRLVREDGWRIAITGSVAEAALARQLQALIGPPAMSLAGMLDLPTLAAVIERAPLMVSNNTGPAHLAAAVGTPVVALYALTNPQHVPWQVPSRVLSHEVDCAWCYRSVCPEGHGNCLRLVSPGEVVVAVRELTGASSLAGAAR